nr:mki67 interacting nucleolar phosphoprotein [Hymenolepis microstoma]
MEDKKIKRVSNGAARRNNKVSKSRTVACLKITHLPKQFQEEQIKMYFSQFGTVLGVYVPKSKKTLRPKSIAFVLVKKEIAEIIASTVHNVLNFNKIMQCEVLDHFFPSWFRRTPQTVTTVEKEKLLRARTAVKGSKEVPKRRMKDLNSRILALKKANPKYELALASEDGPSKSSS